MNRKIIELLDQLDEELEKEGLPAFYIVGDRKDRSIQFSIHDGKEKEADVSALMKWLAVDAGHDDDKEIVFMSNQLKSAVFNVASELFKAYPKSYFDMGESIGLIKQKIRLPESFVNQKGN